MNWVRHFPLTKSIVIVVVVLNVIVICFFCYYRRFIPEIDIPGGVKDVMQWLNNVVIPGYLLKSGYEHTLDKKDKGKEGSES